MNSDTESLQSNVISDLDANISITQARIDHLKKAGGLRFVGSRAEVYRPNKEARQELRELTDRLELLYEARRKAKPVTNPQPVQPYRKQAPLHVTSITARQSSSNVETEEEVSTTLARVLLIAEQTDINLKKWIEETDRDPELNLLRQALLDKNTKQKPASFKLYQNELRVSMGLIFVEDKIVVPRTLREWVMQVAHGDHASLHKMVALTDQVYWPGKRHDLEKKPKDCLVCFQAGKILNSKLPKTEKNILPPTKAVSEEIQFDFLGPIINEKGHKKFILVVVDNCSKWLWAKVTKACNSKTAMALLNKIIEETGVPRTIKTDNASAFTSNKFQDFVNRYHIKHHFSTPYVHTPIGTVERNLRTLENYIRTFLIEDNNLKSAVKPATKVIRFTISKSTGLTPFEKHFGRKPRNVFNNLLDLENPGRGLLEKVFDMDGSHLAQNSYDADLLQRMVFNRTHGRSASDEDIQKELLKRQVRPKFQYFVVKNHSRKGMESRFNLEPHFEVSEAKHTVFDGKTTYHKKDIADVTQTVLNNPDFFQGKITYDTRYRDQGRDGSGKFTTPDNAVRTRSPFAATRRTRLPPKAQPRPVATHWPLTSPHKPPAQPRGRAEENVVAKPKRLEYRLLKRNTPGLTTRTPMTLIYSLSRNDNAPASAMSNHQWPLLRYRTPQAHQAASGQIRE